MIPVVGQGAWAADGPGPGIALVGPAIDGIHSFLCRFPDNWPITVTLRKTIVPQHLCLSFRPVVNQSTLPPSYIFDLGTHILSFSHCRDYAPDDEKCNSCQDVNQLETHGMPLSDLMGPIPF